MYCWGECRWVDENISLGQLDGVKTKSVILRKYTPLLIIQEKLVYTNLTIFFLQLLVCEQSPALISFLWQLQPSCAERSRVRLISKLCSFSVSIGVLCISVHQNVYNICIKSGNVHVHTFSTHI